MNRKRNRHNHSHANDTTNYTPTTEAFLMGFGLGVALVEFLAAGFGYF